MHISPKFALYAAAPFSLLCLGVAIYGFISLDEITDPVLMSDAKGYIGFWLFLAAISVASGALSWWLMTKQQNEA